MNEGECAPGASVACDNCGTKTCATNCQWNPCSIGTVDSYEPNDTKAAARVLPSIDDKDGSHTYLLANINPAGNHDWYRVFIKDVAGAVMEPFVKLSQVPSGQAYYVCTEFVCEESSGNPPSRQCTVSYGSEVRIDLDVSGCDDNCGAFCFNNSGTLYMQVYPSGSGSCSFYRLDYGA